MADKVGSVFAARISGVTRFGLFVTVTDSGASGLVPVSSLPDDFWIHDEATQTPVRPAHPPRLSPGAGGRGAARRGEPGDRRPGVPHPAGPRAAAGRRPGRSDMAGGALPPAVRIVSFLLLLACCRRLPRPRPSRSCRARRFDQRLVARGHGQRARLHGAAHAGGGAGLAARAVGPARADHARPAAGGRSCSEGSAAADRRRPHAGRPRAARRRTTPRAGARRRRRLVRAGWDASEAVRRAGTQGVLRSFFDELFNHLDPYSRYAPPGRGGRRPHPPRRPGRHRRARWSRRGGGFVVQDGRRRRPGGAGRHPRRRPRRWRWTGRPPRAPTSKR